MQDAVVIINEIPTHIMSWGKWIEESLDGVQEVVICITGNPGLPGYYTQFLSTVHSNLDGKTPVWVIGHAGHDEPPASSIHKVPPLSGNESKFNLDAQVKHKIEFIETYVPKNVKIHLIGHSIGAWMILQLLRESHIKDRIKKCYLLFPTVERMAASPNGRLYTRFVLPIYFIIAFFMKVLQFVPLFIRAMILSVYFQLASIPQFLVSITLKFLQPKVLDSAIFLTRDEMKRVAELDIENIKNNLSLLKFYYGMNDGWVPEKYFDEIKERVPGIDATLDQNSISHSFVLWESILMGEIVAEWIKPNY